MFIARNCVDGELEVLDCFGRSRRRPVDDPLRRGFVRITPVPGPSRARAISGAAAQPGRPVERLLTMRAADTGVAQQHVCLGDRPLPHARQGIGECRDAFDERRHTGRGQPIPGGSTRFRSSAARIRTGVSNEISTARQISAS